ncbi:MAG: hypothetical protein SWH68_06440 [Thermodesulfobacteriota bacterium]|nr:hypothetical protein [Thermodesulfobacteriota bacterium]
MIRKIALALFNAAIIALLYIIVANIVYYFTYDNTMWENWNYYGWVQYSYTAGLMLVLVSIFEVVRAITGRK